MKEDPVLQNVFGTIGTVLWSAQIVPQIYKNYKSKSTYGLSPHLFIIWVLAALFLGVYNILQNINVALIVQPQSFGFLGAFCWVQCLYYADGPEPDPQEEDFYDDPKRRRRKPLSLRNACIVFVGFLILATAFECGFVYVLRATASQPADGPPPQVNKAGLQFFGITAAILISFGLFPQYYEIYRLRRVVGVSYLFMAVDTLGGVFSLLSLAFKEKWDAVASSNYALVIALDCLVLLLAAVLNPIANRRAKRAQELAEELKNEKERPRCQVGSEEPFGDRGPPQSGDASASSRRRDLQVQESPIEGSADGEEKVTEQESNSRRSITSQEDHNHLGMLDDHNPHGV